MEGEALNEHLIVPRGITLKWFKHFSNASTSLKLNRLVDDMGIEGYGRYWLLLELLAEKFDGKSTKIHLHYSEISKKVDIKFSKKLATFLQKLADFSLLSYQVSGRFYEIEAPILRELQDKDSKYNRNKIASRSQSATLEEEVELDKEVELDISSNSAKKNLPKAKPLDKPKLIGPLPEFSSNSMASEFLKTVPHTTQILWMKTYHDIPWMLSEFIKMVNWIEVNQNKAPKLISRFANSWLSRAWEDHRKAVPSKSSNQSHRVLEHREVPRLTDRQVQLLKEAGQI